MAEATERPSVASNFNRAHANRLRSPTMERLWRTAYGNDYPAEIKPSAFYSLSTLQRLRGALGLSTGDTLVDLGCGHGGAGIWVAQQLGVNLIGIDLSPGGVALAADHAAELGFGERAKFQVGDMTATGLPDGSYDAAMSLDVLVFVPDKAAALCETARILRPGGRFGFTTWEQTGYSERLNAQQFDDYRPVLSVAGFEVEVYAEPQDWQSQQRRLLEALIGHESELVSELGTTEAARFLAMARGSLSDLPLRRYVLGVGRRR
jgi:SAM-dependent methyltransferase